ncbi:MAG: lytic murein transglycosylase, partial [Alphaproteobacteria bacterium]
KQGVFAQSFLQFSNRMVAQYRLDQGRANLKKYKSLFADIENQYGVPGPVIAGFWGLETDYGGNTGDFPTIRALATLAHDCRRPELFRPQLMDALRLADVGDLAIAEMKGAWAGELGQMQFLPSDYFESAVDYDGDGRRNLIRSTPDALASTANVLASFGWHRGEPWLQEVRVPDNLPWDQADLAIRLPRSQWVKWGVRAASGKLPADQTPTALILPMGRNGPAFLAYRNFDIYLKWNRSFVYSTTAAYFATRLAGTTKVSAGKAKVTPLSLRQTKQLQEILAGRGYDVGKIDGVIGARTRAAVKDAQMKLGMPADSYPTPTLLARLR